MGKIFCEVSPPATHKMGGGLDILLRGGSTRVQTPPFLLRILLFFHVKLWSKPVNLKGLHKWAPSISYTCTCMSILKYKSGSAIYVSSFVLHLLTC